MKIIIGSKNPQKIVAVKEYDFLKNAAVESVAGVYQAGAAYRADSFGK